MLAHINISFKGHSKIWENRKLHSKPLFCYFSLRAPDEFNRASFSLFNRVTNPVSAPTVSPTSIPPVWSCSKPWKAFLLTQKCHNILEIFLSIYSPVIPRDRVPIAQHQGSWSRVCHLSWNSGFALIYVRHRPTWSVIKAQISCPTCNLNLT